MQSNHFQCWLPPVAGFTLLAVAIAAQAGTGARGFAQAWNPLTPDQPNVVPLFDEPSLVSDSLQEAWQRVRPRLCAQLQARMGVAGAARGETLRDITCLLDEQVALDVAPAGQNALRASLAVSGYVEATSTTPDIIWGIGVDRAADPRFSVALTARVDLVLAVQPSREQTLRVSQARFTLNNATLDSHNFSGDIAEWAVGDMLPFFGGPDYKAMAENAINAVSMDFASDFNAALAPVNQKLAGPSELVRVGVSGSGNYISVAFAPREFTPPANGSVSGMVRWDPARFVPRDGCRSFDIRDTVQTGPVPMYTANAEAPKREIGTLHISEAGPGACSFTLSGIAEGWPNVLSAKLVGANNAASAGNALYRIHYGLSGDGWDGRNVVPAPVASARDYVVSGRIDATDTPSAGHAAMSRMKRADAVINPAERYTQRSDPGKAQVAVSPMNRISQSGDTVSLNPQPLPPASVNARVRRASAVQRAQPNASATAIEEATGTPQP